MANLTHLAIITTATDSSPTANASAINNNNCDDANEFSASDAPLSDTGVNISTANKIFCINQDEFFFKF